MKILVLNGSPRKNGNTEILADAFIRGAKESGHEVVKFDTGSMKIGACRACDYCHSHNGECVQKDDMTSVYETMRSADMVVFASPIYWFAMSAQVKLAIDRFYALGMVGFHPTKAALLLDAHSEGVFDSAVEQYKGINAYLKWQDMGVITVSGMEKKGDIEKSPKLKEAYELGKNLK